MSSTTPSPSHRLLPYARDHDRFMVALLYLDHQEFMVPVLNRRIEKLKKRQEWLAQCIRVKEASLAEIQASGDVTEEQKKGLLEALVEEIQATRNELDGIKGYTNNETVARDQVRADLSHRKKLADLLDKLYSSAFDGETPEFPHEDRLEALVTAARLECEKCLQANMTLMDQARRVSHMNSVIAELVRLLQLEYQSYSGRDRQAAGDTLLDDRWREALRLYNDLEGLTRQYTDDQPSYPIHQLGQVDNQEDFLRAMRNATHAAAKRQVAGRVLEHMLEQTNLLCCSLRAIQLDNAQRREQGMKKLKAARLALELRVIQLLETRRRILDHVIDPDNCPLDDPLVELPDYSPRRTVLYPVTFRPFDQTGGETISREEYLEQIIDSWFSRVQRADYAPIPLPESYAPPKYSDIDESITDGDGESVHTLRVTPGFQVRFVISRRATCWCEELESLLARASEHLLPVVNHV